VQGRMGRTAALGKGSQDQVREGRFVELRLLDLLERLPLWSFQRFASGRMGTPGSTSLNVTFPGA
jgi:hypothetical protein